MTSRKLDFSSEIPRVSRQLFDDDEPEVNNMSKNLEKKDMMPGDKYVSRWAEYFYEGILDQIPNINLPTQRITIPISIINELKNLRQGNNEWGGEFYFEDNIITSYSKLEGDEHSVNMTIDPQKQLMYHTHPSSKDRVFSPPSEIDIATLFRNSINANRCIPHLVFSREGIYLIYCHSQIINQSYQNERLRNEDSRDGVIDFHLQESIQDLRILLGYKKFNGGPVKEIEAKIDINRFIELINKMGFVLKLYPYPTTDLEIELPNNSEILIGGSNPKYKVIY